MTSEPDARIAYFSMEIAAAPRFLTYAGGLGVLAGDMLRSAADLAIPMVGLTLLHRKGYFRQQLDGKGQQSEEPQEWNPEGVLEPLEPEAYAQIMRSTIAVNGSFFNTQRVSLPSFNAMYRQGNFLSCESACTSCISKQSLHGAGAWRGSKFKQVGES